MDVQRDWIGLGFQGLDQLRFFGFGLASQGLDLLFRIWICVGSSGLGSVRVLDLLRFFGSGFALVLRILDQGTVRCFDNTKMHRGGPCSKEIGDTFPGFMGKLRGYYRQLLRGKYSPKVIS